MVEKIKEHYVDKAWLLLKEDFASREDNNSTHSGQGGDLDKFIFVLFTDIVLQESNSKKESLPHFEKFGDGLKLVYYPYHQISVKELRSRFDYYYENGIATQHLIGNMLPDIDKERVCDYEYMKQWKGRSLNMDIYLVALQKADRLSILLKESVPLRTELSKKFRQEKNAFITDFAREQDVYVDVESNYSEIINIIKRHDVYSSRLQAIYDSEAEVTKALLGYEEQTLLKFLGSVPVWLVVMAFRKFVGIEQIIKYELDEFLRSSDVGLK